MKFEDDELNNSIQFYLKDLRKLKSLTKKEEHELLKEYKEQNNLSARNKLILSNLKYSCKLASTFRGRGIDFPDLIAEANNGLIDAIERFDLSKNVKVICYAKWYIMQRMEAAINNKNKIQSITLNEVIKTDNNDNEDETNNISDKNVDEPIEKHEDNNVDNTNNTDNFLNNIFKKLNARESDMVNMYYGRGYNQEYTLEEIGAKYSLTKERVRQIIETSFKKLRSEALICESSYSY